MDKQKLTEIRDNVFQLYRERPVEMLIATAALCGGVAKLMTSVTDSRNAETWRREVRRRERNARF